MIELRFGMGRSCYSFHQGGISLVSMSMRRRRTTTKWFAFVSTLVRSCYSFHQGKLIWYPRKNWPLLSASVGSRFSFHQSNRTLYQGIYAGKDQISGLCFAHRYDYALLFISRIILWYGCQSIHTQGGKQIFGLCFGMLKCFFFSG